MSTLRVKARNGARTSINLIHDDVGAQANGYRMALVPGGTIYAYLLRAVIATWGLPWVDHGTSEVYWRRPVYEDDHLEVRPVGPAKRSDRLTVEAVNERGEMAATVIAGLAPDVVPAPPASDYPVVAPDGPLVLLPGERLRPGISFADAEMTISEADVASYLDEIDEDSDLFCRDGIVHPAYLHRLASGLLFRSIRFDTSFQVAASGVSQHFAAVRVGDAIVQQNRIVASWTERGHEYVTVRSTFLRASQVVALIDRSSIYRLKAHRPDDSRTDTK